jgi:membrane associated rhomboid family serine protease
VTLTLCFRRCESFARAALPLHYATNLNLRSDPRTSPLSQYAAKDRVHTTEYLSLSRSSNNFWEGDDIRWIRKLRRRIQRPFRLDGTDSTPARNVLLLLNITMFLYQVVTSVNHVRLSYPQYWPSHAGTIALDSLLGSTRAGPLMNDFCFSTQLARIQPHRYITSGFLHGGLIHVVANMDALRSLPAWLETGMGTPLYITTFLLSIVAGNLGHSFINISYNTNPLAASAICVGSSGGIAGLYGLMFVSLSRMGNAQAAARVAKGMGLMLLYGLFFTNISNASHVGGFIGGVIAALLFSPKYKQSYQLRRKWSVEADPVPRDYRLAMGYGNIPTRSGLIPLSVLWVGIAVVFLSVPSLRHIPNAVLQGLLRPGSVSSMIT